MKIAFQRLRPAQATFKKLVPRDCMSVCTEACTDVDKYQVDFKADATAEQKADALAALLLTEYMFFEQDVGTLRCKSVDNGCNIYFVCFLCSIYGCLCPCELMIPIRQQQG